MREPSRHSAARPAGIPCGGATAASDIATRLDALPWSGFHWRVVIALGITWILDGLEVTLMGAISGILQDPATLHLDCAQIGLIASAYLAGAVSGALVFGWATDRFGRQRLFFITLSVYLAGAFATAFAWNLASFAAFRFITGAGIGGEYGAVNSAIDELIPARLRGRVDLIINGSYWIGAAIGAAATIVLLDPGRLPVNLGWRVGFGAGAVLGLIVICLRRYIPESPRWLAAHGYQREAARVLTNIERRIRGEAVHGGAAAHTALGHDRRHAFGLRTMLRTIVLTYRRRAVVGFVLMTAQAFLYNAIFFTYALVLTRFYAVPASATGTYLLPFALGNFLGPLLLGHWFDSLGRKPMIAGTYAVSAALLMLTGMLFAHGALSARGQTAMWTLIFFFASAAASSAYLTVGEIFPLEARALAIALFFAVGTAVGGVVAPSLFGLLIGSGSRVNLLYGYLLAAMLMLFAALIELRFGVKAERQPLEAIALPGALAVRCRIDAPPAKRMV